MTYTLEERLGRRIKAMLALRGMNQSQLAEATGMSTQTVSLMCNGKADFRMSTLRRIEVALECTLVLIPNEDLI
ncbi:MAG: helix-turn-helix domain-containing protein [Paludibacteraceae bacterium]|nr:helix-turn-helix domain-containing protein [Paludibacteraceae bacterium]